MFAPRFFGVRHFAPRHFAPNRDIPVEDLVEVGGVWQSPTPSTGPRYDHEFIHRANVAKQAFDAREIEWNEQLGRTLEATYAKVLRQNDVAAPSKTKPTRTIRKRVTRRVYEAEIVSEMGLKLNDIGRLVDEFANVLHSNWLDILRRDDEEAIILLLLGA